MRKAPYRPLTDEELKMTDDELMAWINEQNAKDAQHRAALKAERKESEQMDEKNKEPETMADFANLDKRPQYFSMFIEVCEMLSLMSNDSAGRIIKAISDYFIDGTSYEDTSDFSKEERRAYNRIVKNVDDSCVQWYAKVKAGKNGALKRYGKG